MGTNQHPVKLLQVPCASPGVPQIELGNQIRPPLCQWKISLHQPSHGAAEFGMGGTHVPDG